MFFPCFSFQFSSCSLATLGQPLSSDFMFHADALPEGLTRELPSADEFQNASTSGSADAYIDDLEDLRKQLEALNSI